MVVKKKTNKLLFSIIGIIILSLLILGGIYLFTRDKCPDNHVCIHKKEYNKPSEPKQESKQEPKIIIIKESSQQAPIYQTTDTRDRRVLNDQLYPPLNRTDATTFNGVVRETANRNINVPINQSYDSFRLVGYITSQEGEKDSGGGSWKLMGKTKNRNESEFYLIPTNNNYDLKIPITSDIVVGQRLRDVYTIPKEIQFKSPMLNQAPYQFIELPKADFIDPRYS